MKTFTTDQQDHGQTLAAVVRRRWQLSWSAAKKLIESKALRVAGQPCSDPSRRIKVGQVIAENPIRKNERGRPASPILKPAHKKSLAIPEGIVVRYQDDQILVVEKPPGLTTMRHQSEAAEFGSRGQKFLPKTLVDFLHVIVNDGGPIISVHRIDKETSGIVAFARTPDAAQNLGRQFRSHSIERVYLAIARGRPKDGRIESWLVRDRGDGRRGSNSEQSGERSVTHIKTVKTLGGLSLLECRLETGRTHQIRIHLGEGGCPLAGETVYDRPIHGRPVPDPSGANRVMLHAAVLGLIHPSTGKSMRWESAIPADMQAIIAKFAEVVT